MTADKYKEQQCTQQLLALFALQEVASFSSGQRLATQAAVNLRRELDLTKKEDLIPLFNKLDANSDGKVAISELVLEARRVLLLVSF